MSENPVEIVVEPPLPDVQIVLEPAPPDVFVNVEPSVPDVSISVDAEPEIVVVGTQELLPDVVVEVAEVGLAGPPGGQGPPGPAAGTGTPSVEVVNLVNTSIETHVEDLTPHPVYDDGPSLMLLYQNAKV